MLFVLTTWMLLTRRPLRRPMLFISTLMWVVATMVSLLVRLSVSSPLIALFVLSHLIHIRHPSTSCIMS